MNAIFLAAGRGSRFKEWTKHKHKALLPINEVPNIERTIQFLMAAEIDEIYIVTGHLANQFAYLAHKYPKITLIYNDMYRQYNSMYSFKLASSYFENSFVIDADTVLRENVFLNIEPKQSTYFTIERQNQEKEWCPLLDSHQKVIDIKITNERLASLSGISYWAYADCQIIKQHLSDFLTPTNLKNHSLYWDNIPLYLLEYLNITVHRLQQNSVYEMDNQCDYLNIVNAIKFSSKIGKDAPTSNNL